MTNAEDNRPTSDTAGQDPANHEDALGLGADFGRELNGSTALDADSAASLDQPQAGSATPSLEEMMAQAQQLQASMQQAQEQLSQAKVEGEADNGAVRALVSGTGVLLDLRIAPAVINPQDPQTLIRLILAAVHDAGEKATAMQERVLNEISPEMVSMLGGGDDADSTP